jgi:hypothetical protein
MLGGVRILLLLRRGSVHAKAINYSLLLVAHPECLSKHEISAVDHYILCDRCGALFGIGRHLHLFSRQL